MRATLMTTALLLVVQGRPCGKRFVLPNGEYYIGRGAECHVRPDSDWVSRQHCLLRVAGDGVFLRDLGSRNGTLVNGRLLSGETRLGHGDRIQIGPLAFEVRLEELETATRTAAEGGVETVPVAPKRPEKRAPTLPAEPPDEPGPPE